MKVTDFSMDSLLQKPLSIDHKFSLKGSCYQYHFTDEEIKGYLNESHKFLQTSIVVRKFYYGDKLLVFESWLQRLLLMFL